MNSLRPKHKGSSFESKDNLKNYVRIWVHCWKLGEFTENKAGHILNLMDEISKVFFTENEWVKINFPFWKTKFGTHWEFCAYHRIFGFWKGPAG